MVISLFLQLIPTFEETYFVKMYNILKSAHSGWRYIVLVLLVIAVINALMGWFGKKTYTEGNRKLNVFTLISAHIQLLIGLVLFFLSPLTKLPMSEAIGRYFKAEHTLLMLIAIVLITVGNAKSKKIADAVAKHRTIAVFFGIALLVIIGSIFMMTRIAPERSFFGIS